MQTRNTLSHSTLHPLESAVGVESNPKITDLQQARQKAHTRFAEEMAALQEQISLVKRNHEQQLSGIRKHHYTLKESLHQASINQTASKQQHPRKATIPQPVRSPHRVDTYPDETVSG